MKKKLIEVALPLEAINRESAREKSIRHGHPSTLHLWWARRPLAACRAVLFASLVDDPSSLPEEFPTEEAQEKERQRLFRIIEELVRWENSNNEEVLGRARAEIMKSTGGNPPPVLDPFCGGGSIPLEAQRLGLEAHASDLNPVAVLITKALIEIPPKFANQPPVNPDARKNLAHSARWKEAQGLAEDVRFYGKWMRDEAERRIGHIYPKVKLQNGNEATAIAWLWARTVRCPNPACGIEMPLVRTFALASKRGKEYSVRPTIEGKRVVFGVDRKASTQPGTMNRRGAVCLACGGSVTFAQLRQWGRAGLLGRSLLAIVAKDGRSRTYVAPTREHEMLAMNIEAPDYPVTALPDKGLGFRVQAYGLLRHADLFTSRQLVALNALAECASEVRQRIFCDAIASGNSEQIAASYRDNLGLILALTVSKAARFHTVLSYWRADEGKLSRAFGRQTVSLAWDFAEANPFAKSGGDFEELSDGTAEVLDGVPAGPPSVAYQLDARSPRARTDFLVSTDPPYYDNVGYADLSDIFYIWLRRVAAALLPDLFSTVLVPKTQELVADADRFGGAEAAEARFLEGTQAIFQELETVAHPNFPLTIYYAFRQSEVDEDGAGESALSGNARASTGWETFLEGVMRAGFRVVATLPLRTEGPTRMRGQNSNALASSIALVARRRSASAAIATRREFIAALKSELPDALKKLQHSSIAAVDLAQAAIGPGMAVFSRYAKVIEADGSSMRVRSALQLINQALDEVLSEQESEYDADTQWAVAWFDQYGTSEAPFGDADTLSRAKNTSVGGLVESGLLRAAKGKVQLIGREEFDATWDPATDRRLTIWEVAQHLIARLKSGGEQTAADLLRRVGGMGEIARDLAYRLYAVCERKGWTEEAIAYNSLVVAWPEIARLAAETETHVAAEQMPLS
jgi:putative DNA methylase